MSWLTGTNKRMAKYGVFDFEMCICAYVASTKLSLRIHSWAGKSVWRLHVLLTPVT
jgi:hypothetical protein